MGLAKVAVALSQLIAPVLAFLTIPQFVGLAGAGKSLLVGAGTAIGGTLTAASGAAILGVAGVLTGQFLKAVTGGKAPVSSMALGLGGLALGGVIGVGPGIYHGYTLSKDWLTNANEICAPAKQEQKTSLLLGAPTQTVTFSKDKTTFG